MKMKVFQASYRPFVTVKRRKHYTADVDLQVEARNKRDAIKKTVETLRDWDTSIPPTIRDT